MTKQVTATAPYTKARHYRDAYINGKGEKVPVNFTVLSRLECHEDGTPHTAKYKVSFCSRRDTFKKKTGVQQALKAVEYSVCLNESKKECEKSGYSWEDRSEFYDGAILVDIMKRTEDGTLNVPRFFSQFIKDTTDNGEF